MNQNQFPEEYALRLRWNGGAVTLICTPEHLKELICGFLYNERLISSPDQIRSLEIDPEKGDAEAVLADSPSAGEWIRPSGMGSPGLIRTEELRKHEIQRRFCAGYIRQCAAAMDERAVQHARTGGMHCSALFDGERLLACYEDIGRHNTLDKLAGACLLQGIDAWDTLLITTGRISGDMVRKAGTLGASVVASYSNATSLAYDTAQSAGITLAGHLKWKKISVFCHEERIF